MHDGEMLDCFCSVNVLPVCHAISLYRWVGESAANPAAAVTGPAQPGTPDNKCATIGTGANQAYCATCQSGYFLASATATACTGALYLQSLERCSFFLEAPCGKISDSLFFVPFALLRCVILSVEWGGWVGASAVNPTPAAIGTGTACATIGTGANQAYCATCQTGFYLASATATTCTGTFCWRKFEMCCC